MATSTPSSPWTPMLPKHLVLPETSLYYNLEVSAARYPTRPACFYYGGALDYAGFHSPALDSLFAAARTAPTTESRIAAWRRVEENLAGAMPVAWIYHSRGVQGVASSLKNVVMDLRGELPTIARWERATK